MSAGRSLADAAATARARLAELDDDPRTAWVVRAARWTAGLAALWLAIDATLGLTVSTAFNGAVVGGTIYGLVGVGIILIHRTNRIINFAAAGLGALPGITLSLLVAIHGWSWWLALPLSILAGAAVGALTDIVVIRRFARAPRLILTVATIGVAQIFAFLSLLAGIRLGTDGRAVQMQSPFTSTTFTLGHSIFTGDYPVALVAVAIAVVALTAFLRRSRLGIAMRASAENADRAALLGIPVRRVQTATWVVAGALASMVIFLRSTLVGVPADGSLGPKVFLFSLAAAVLARLESIPRCLVAGMGIGIVASATLSKTGKDSLTAAVMLVVLLVALLVQRKALSRAQDVEASSWSAAAEFRPIPPELRRLPEVVAGKAVVAALAAAFFLVYPLVVGESRIGFAHSVVISSIVAVSLVVLTGWAGQISLGQYGIVGVGAVTAGSLVTRFEADFFVAVALSMLAGALVAVLIGLPAVRMQGLYLAVTTLAFGAAMQYFFLDRSYALPKLILPPRSAEIRTPVLWQRLALGDGVIPTRGFYYLCLAFLGIALLMARAYRSNRAGRAVVAVRENPRAASSYSVNPARTRLGAFAVSGAIAAMAGALLVHQSGAVDASTYGIDRSIGIFVIVVIGGLTSLPGAVMGAVLIETTRFFGSEGLELLVTGPGLLLVLLALPGGFAEGMHRIRDAYLRAVARRRGIDVPSLTADRRVTTGEGEERVLRDAEARVEAADEGLLGERRVVCPVCSAELALEDAAEHEHLRAGAPVPAGAGTGR